MENLSEKILSVIAVQMRMNIENIVHDPFFVKNGNLWRCCVDVNKPTFGSLKFDIIETANKELSDLSFEFYSEENRVLLEGIFEKVSILVNKTTVEIFQSENCITLNWKLNLNNDVESFEFVCKTYGFFRKFFILIKDLNLIELKRKNELFDRKSRIYGFKRKTNFNAKLNMIGTPKRSLIRKDRPAVSSLIKIYYYSDQSKIPLE